jgi:large subunit ribosomal protein L25
MRKVKVRTTPEHLIDKIVLDTTPMALGQSQRIKDLKEYEGVEVLNNENIPVATIDIPRALRGGTDDAAAATTATSTTPAAAKTAAPAKAAAPAKTAAPAKDAGKKKK